MNLDSPITDLPKIGPILENKFKKLGIHSINDLFYHVPSHYLDYSLITTINKIKVGDTVTIHAKIISITNIFSKRGVRMQIGSVEDINSLPAGRQGKLVPVYPETAGLSSKWLRRTILNAFENTKIEDFLKDKLDLKTAIKFVHFPKNLDEVEKGKERLGFNEMLFLQLKSQRKKIAWQKNKTPFKLSINRLAVKQFISSLPFKLTDSQNKSVKEILSDLQRDIPMNRLLQGDVGSGKTVVAAVGAFAAFTNGYQTIIMAPTQILAEQHFKTLRSIFPKQKISLVTSNSKKVESADLYVGTHALIHSKINFEKVALIVIDEQHRFGVEQRSLLTKKSGIPHVLTMTATPIPRTIALTTYGDLELSVLNEMPIGRQKINTWLVPPEKREKAYDWIKSQVSTHKSQVFIVCPLIQDSEKETMKDIRSVTTEYENLKLKINNLKFGLLHGKMKHEEKNEVLSDFRSRRIDILVSTPVVEVGIDIPNATIMVIEAAERFGLAQLHQLRGRVGRGEKKSYCLLFANVHSGNAFKRLKAMEKMHSGFELAELDLELRGPGEIFGTQQSGFVELKIASWNDYELIKETKSLAEEILANPKRYPLIKALPEISLA